MINPRHLSLLILLSLSAPFFARAPEGALRPLARAQEVPEEPVERAPDLEQVKRGDLSAIGAIDEEHPERSVPTPEQALKNPLEMGYLVMDLVARAEAASQRGDHAAAVRYYAAIAKAVPERSVSYTKM